MDRQVAYIVNDCEKDVYLLNKQVFTSSTVFLEF